MIVIWIVARIISSRKTYCLYGLKHHIVTDVTDAGQTTEQGKIVLFSLWTVRRLSFAIEIKMPQHCCDFNSDGWSSRWTSGSE